MKEPEERMFASLEVVRPWQCQYFHDGGVGNGRKYHRRHRPISQNTLTLRPLRPWGQNAKDDIERLAK